MPECRNCGGFVSSDYARVFSHHDDGTVDVCPECESLIRGADGRPREQRM
jgi:NAD-dependent SIR2 family protein deacetylase